jgi:hypothetical protein
MTKEVEDEEDDDVPRLSMRQAAVDALDAAEMRVCREHGDWGIR